MDIDKIVCELLNDLSPTPGSEQVCVRDVPGHLEHSLLNPDISLSKIIEQTLLARQHNVAAVCVSPYYVPFAAEVLRGSPVKIGTAIGFPHGAMSYEAKLAELKNCIAMGAEEIDVSINMLAIKSGRIEDAKTELDCLVAAANGRAVIKAVFEHSVYTDEEKLSVLQMIVASGAEYVKIQNVLSGKGAEASDVIFAKNFLRNAVKIKIDGGVKTLKKAIELIAAGADRIGLTATIAIAIESGK